jgi:hypothetical protein
MEIVMTTYRIQELESLVSSELEWDSPRASNAMEYSELALATSPNHLQYGIDGEYPGKLGVGQEEEEEEVEV